MRYVEETLPAVVIAIGVGALGHHEPLFLEFSFCSMACSFHRHHHHFAGLPLLSLCDSAAQGRWFVLQAQLVVEAMTAPAPIEVVGASSASGSGPSKQCVCSPTQHSGSFRCRHHHAEYEWGGRQRPRP
ncbi:hypothetical protein HHK36_025677 [Tetracentron sinense]|uniref:Uncharacterized protein n=1 Tax=Tetracentron sinense TaxID=13715 RepID=A0A835D3D0_TETSI|nr:hypothetical protein HHK36_025677 [Tetracentron sinense]